MRDAVIAIDPGDPSGWAAASIGPDPSLLLSGIYKFAHPTKGQQRTPSALVRFLLHWAATAAVTIAQVGIEDQYLGENPNSLKKLARNGGRWEEAFVEASITPVKFIPPSTWQSKELRMGNAKSAILRRAADGKAYGLWRLEGSEHEVDAALIARYMGITMYHEIERQKA